MIKTFLALSVLATSAYAQSFGAGLKVGVPATDYYKVLPFPTFAAFNAAADRFVVGPYFEFRLPANMAVEVDALHRSHSYVTALGSQSASAWEFPLLLKHRIGSQLIRPYFEGGLTLSHISDVNVINLAHRNNGGLVVGGGLEFKVLAVRISPEVRYTAYAFKTLDQSLAESHRNQLTVLFGIGF